jgi:hypothetical protein
MPPATPRRYAACWRIVRTCVPVWRCSPKLCVTSGRSGYTGRPINVDSHRRTPEQISQWLREAGFSIEAEFLMRPDDEVPGAIAFARKPFAD